MSLAAPGVNDAAPLLERLVALRNGDGGWPYYAGKRSRLEATCWAALATGTSLDATPVPGWIGPTDLAIEPSTGQVNYGFNGLAALALAADAGTRPLAVRVSSGLLAVKGVAVPITPVVRQDSTLQGWSWTAGTFTWIEPTAWCLLAVKRLQPRATGAAARIDEAERVMRDRACTGGGWNFGNGVVFGNELPPHVPPTALAVLALQDRPADPLVTAAAAVLERQAIREGSMTAMALSILALRSIGREAGPVLSALKTLCHSSLGLENAATLGLAAYVLQWAGRRDAHVLQLGSPS